MTTDAITRDEIIDLLDDKALVAYYTADHGASLGVSRRADGWLYWYVGDSVGREIDPDERPIAMVACPGLANLTMSEWSDESDDVDPETVVTDAIWEGRLTDPNCTLYRLYDDLVEALLADDLHGLER